MHIEYVKEEMKNGGREISTIERVLNADITSIVTACTLDVIYVDMEPYKVLRREGAIKGSSLTVFLGKPAEIPLG